MILIQNGKNYGFSGKVAGYDFAGTCFLHSGWWGLGWASAARGLGRAARA
jgi:hypothetical protein